MSSADPNELAEAIRRGHWTAREEAQLEAYLAGHPEQRAAWEEELALNSLLRQVPDVPVSTNFTARVLQAVQAEEQARAGSASPFRDALSWRRWWPKLAVTGAALCLGLFSYQHHRAAVRQEMARNVAEVLASGATLDVLRDFDVIQRLNQVPRDRDKELIAALQ